MELRMFLLPGGLGRWSWQVNERIGRTERTIGAGYEDTEGKAKSRMFSCAAERWGLAMKAKPSMLTPEADIL